MKLSRHKNLMIKHPLSIISTFIQYVSYRLHITSPAAGLVDRAVQVSVIRAETCSVSVTKTGCYNRKLKVDYEEIKWNIYSEFIM